MYSLIDLIVTAFTFLIIGTSLGAILVASAENCEEDATEIIYNAGYERGKADEQKRIMDKLDEYKKGDAKC